MKKSLIIGTMFALTTLAGCATTSTTTAQPSGQAVAQMQVAPVKLTLRQKYQNHIFYDEKALASRMTECVKDELSKKNKLSTDSTSPMLNVTVDYKRTYSGEALGLDNTIADVRFEYDYQIAKNGQVLQQNSAKDRIVHQGLVTVFTMGLANSTQASEDKFITGVCQDIVKTIK